MIRKKYCGTAAKAGGNGEDKPHPKITGVPCLLKNQRILLLLLTLSTHVLAADRLASMVVPRMATAPVVDGRETSNEWDGATLVTGFSRYGGEAPPLDWRQTRVWVGFDDTQFYLAMESPNYPEGVPLRSIKTRRDGGFFGDDVFELLLDPYNGDHRGSQPFYYIIANSCGVICLDSRTMPGLGQNETTWNSSLEMANRVNDATWRLEMAIPLADLGIEDISPYLCGGSVSHAPTHAQWHGPVGPVSARSIVHPALPAPVSRPSFRLSDWRALRASAMIAPKA
ncbi:MAG: hypothetical protein HQ523_09145 [Lentisphaerae bacterium]|nr:hypothetical protein [Lentisphaerota bacterium]